MALETTMECVAGKPGTFEFHRAHFFGLAQGRMKGRRIAEAAWETPSAN